LIFLIKVFFLLATPSLLALDAGFIKERYGLKDCSVQKKIIILNKRNKDKLIQETRIKGLSNLVRRFEVTCNKEVSSLYALSDVIRTHAQRVLVSIKKNKVYLLDVVKFSEPTRYHPSKVYLDTFKNRDDFKDVDALSGATLTRASLIRLSKTALALEKHEKN